ncbi:MAG: hypothetical protein KDF59_15325 [Nitrosomonas sp.]|nr:hypothetical protein [Nitrosomonas sp.]
MPIEIKQLLIKSNIVQRVVDDTQDMDTERLALKEEIMTECRDLIEDMLQNREER